MIYYLIGVSVLFAATATATSPAISKEYRSDYTYDRDTDSFYKLHKEKVSPQSARLICQSEGATLGSESDLTQVQGMLKSSLDLENLIIADGNSTDPDEVDDDVLVVNTTVTIPEEQVEDDQSLKCKGPQCHRNQHFMCKVAASDAPYSKECDVYSNDYVSKVSLTGSCYRIAKVKANWNEAAANCEAEGGHLVVINNEAEYEVVKDLLRKTPADVEDWQFFVGIRAKKKKTPVVFRTVLNQTLDEVGFQPWDNNEPNNEFGVEYCVSLLKRTLKYNDTVCRNEYSYVCEKERRP